MSSLERKMLRDRMFRHPKHGNIKRKVIKTMQRQRAAEAQARAFQKKDDTSSPQNAQPDQNVAEGPVNDVAE